MKAALLVYLDAAKEWRWRLKLGNGRIIADSGEAYVTRKGALYAARRVVVWAAKAKVELEIA
jgi:uncharacterized protein YegP (UPF0339 family)